MRYLFLPRSETRDIAELQRACFWSGVRPVRWAPDEPWTPLPECSLANATVYGSLRNGRAVAAHLGARVVEPPRDFLCTLPSCYTNRRVALTTLGRVRALGGFIKPAEGKSFPARAYASGAEIGSGDDTEVLIAEVVAFAGEARMFVVDREVRAWSMYVGERDEDALRFARRLLGDVRVDLPPAVVLDVGWIHGRGWSVVEANPVIASSLYDCDPTAVLEVLFRGLLSV